MYVLISNDDGIYSPNFRALYSALVDAGHEVAAVAPMRQQSGVSHALTVYEPLRSTQIIEPDFKGTGVFGTPADCVKLALASLLEKKPDIVMAGINQGPNIGPDIFYSGTVGAAAEGAYEGIPSFAISHGAHNGCANIAEIAKHAVRIAEQVRWEDLGIGRVVNINYPARDLCDCAGIKICSQSTIMWKNAYSEREDPRGAPYWWFTGEQNKDSLVNDTDKTLLMNGYITVTPLKFDHTDQSGIDILRNMNLE